MPASEPMVSLERYRKQLGDIQLYILHWTDTIPKQVASQVDESSNSDSSDTSSDSDSSESSTPPEPKTQHNSGHLLAIGIHRFVHHAMIASTDKSPDLCRWNDIPVQTACGKRFIPSRIALCAVFKPPEGACCMHRGCQHWLDADCA